MLANVVAARTLSINPPDVLFVLSRDQLWAGLQRETQRALEFVLQMQDCAVLKDKGEFVVRNTRRVHDDGNIREGVTSVGRQ